MSGHNKWSSIKHKKGLEDAKRSKIFSKFTKLISIAARKNPDPTTNASLKSVMDQARSVNMPKDNIERAIKKANEKNSVELKEIIIQAIGPSSIALIIEAITDNSNRTINEVKAILNKHNAKMAEAGSLDWMFEKKGVINVELIGKADDFEMVLIDAGAEDILRENEAWTILIPFQNFDTIRGKLKEQNIIIYSSNIQYIAINTNEVDENTQGEVNKLVELLESHEDINDVYTNIQ